ncbi:tail fiber protein [Pseudomonas phage 98PfluR60PP]|uniref:Tail fiber protein n=1 Tax=Pseudomonas phage 98PfluR60PP TaxID=2163965 RepID=A0A2S1PFV6_9CAUD|nr:tail fiber protein [Pseudomonas phage 98PfluR60PP]AWH15461.1 tail fiber protein [Pseudomonas phage 98PfluR60PP]
MFGETCSLSATGTPTCGTGGWVGPVPGDPSTSDIYITATPAFGGIDVNITWPQINPQAVAYVSLYRSLLPDPDSAVVHDQFTGTFYYDRIDDANKPTYYYWVRIMSVNGTLSDMIGPAWSQPKPLIEEMIEQLTGKIDAGVLAQSLKLEIDQITMNKLGITQEMVNRAANDDGLGVRINEVTAHSGETRALLQEEVLARASQGEAFVSTVNTLYAELNGNIAAVQVTTTALTTRVNALAEQITNVETDFDGQLAQVQTNLQTQINTTNGKVTSIGALYTAKVNVNGLIGGFGVYNDGTEVEAGFDVDRFWIGRTDANKRKPFIVDNNIVYINEAAINKLTFSKLRDESGAFIVENGKIKADYISVQNLEVNTARSDNYVPGVSGWILRANGSLEFNGPTSDGGRLTMTNQLISVYNSANRLKVRLGIWG